MGYGSSGLWARGCVRARMRLESIAAVVLRWGVISLLWKGTKCTFGVGLAKIWFYLCLTIVK